MFDCAVMHAMANEKNHQRMESLVAAFCRAADVLNKGRRKFSLWDLESHNLNVGPCSLVILVKWRHSNYVILILCFTSFAAQ